MYNGGDIASFSHGEAERYVGKGLAEYVGAELPTDQSEQSEDVEASEQQPKDEETLKTWGSEIPPLNVIDAATETVETTEAVETIETGVASTDQSEQPEQSTKPKSTTKKEGKK